MTEQQQRVFFYLDNLHTNLLETEAQLTDSLKQSTLMKTIKDMQTLVLVYRNGVFNGSMGVDEVIHKCDMYLDIDISHLEVEND